MVALLVALRRASDGVQKAVNDGNSSRRLQNVHHRAVRDARRNVHRVARYFFGAVAGFPAEQQRQRTQSTEF